MASTASKVVLGSSTIFAGSIIYLVHYQQVEERNKLRAGITLDLERQEKKKENLRMQLQQQEIEKVYRNLEKEQEENKKLN